MIPLLIIALSLHVLQSTVSPGLRHHTSLGGPYTVLSIMHPAVLFRCSNTVPHHLCMVSLATIHHVLSDSQSVCWELYK